MHDNFARLGRRRRASAGLRVEHGTCIELAVSSQSEAQLPKTEQTERRQARPERERRRRGPEVVVPPGRLRAVERLPESPRLPIVQASLAVDGPEIRSRRFEVSWWAKATVAGGRSASVQDSKKQRREMPRDELTGAEERGAKGERESERRGRRGVPLSAGGGARRRALEAEVEAERASSPSAPRHLALLPGLPAPLHPPAAHAQPHTARTSSPPAPPPPWPPPEETTLASPSRRASSSRMPSSAPNRRSRGHQHPARARNRPQAAPWSSSRSGSTSSPRLSCVRSPSLFPPPGAARPADASSSLLAARVTAASLPRAVLDSGGELVLEDPTGATSADPVRLCGSFLPAQMIMVNKVRSSDPAPSSSGES